MAGNALFPLETPCPFQAFDLFPCGAEYNRQVLSDSGLFHTFADPPFPVPPNGSAVALGQMGLRVLTGLTDVRNMRRAGGGIGDTPGRPSLRRPDRLPADAGTP